MRAEPLNYLDRIILFLILHYQFSIMLNRPPPYFPQSQLSPPDDKRYAKFKFVVVGLIIGLIAILTGLGFGLYYLIRWLA